MVDPNSDYSRLQSSRIQDSDDHRMSRVTCQPSHRPLHLRSLEEASRAPSGRKPSKQSASHQHTKSQTRTTSRETACHSNELSHPPYRRPRSKASQELRQVRAKQNELEENAQHYGLWGEIKYLIKSAILGRAERKAYAARQQQREQRAAARARAEKAALPTPICSAKRSHNLQRRNSHDSIIRPQPAVTRSKKEVPPKAYPSVHRKPVPKRTEPRPDISEDTSDPHRATLVKQDPSRHQSVHLITHMASTASSFDSKKVKLKYGPDKRQDRVTQLGDFMGNPEEVIPPVPPKDTILTNTKPSSPKLAPCSVCGALPGLESGFTWTATNLWLCPTCVDPIRSPFEAPPSPKPHHNSPHHTPTSTKISSIRDSVIQKHCSPLSELALRGRCYSDVSAQDALSYNDDGCVSPLGEWEHGQIDMSARMPPPRAHTPTFEEKGKAPAPRLPPLPIIKPLSPVQPKPRATSSVYPEDETPASTPDVPVPAIPTQFRREKTGKSLKGKPRRAVSSVYPADDEGSSELDAPLPPVSSKGAEGRPASLRLQGKNYRRPRVEEVREEEGNLLGVKRLDNRRSSFYRPEKEIFAQY